MIARCARLALRPLYALPARVFSGVPKFDPKEDYYKALGLNQRATQKEIKTAYFKNAKKYHPDLNAGTRASKV